MPDRKVHVETGLYGDLAGNLERLDPRRADAVAAIVEWEDLDPRLGYRSSQAWRAAQMEDCLATASLQLDRLRTAVDRLAAQVPLSVACPRCRSPPRSGRLSVGATRLHWRFRNGSPHLAAAASASGTRVVSPHRLDQFSPPGQRADVTSHLRFGFPYSLEHASILCEMLAN